MNKSLLHRLRRISLDFIIFFIPLFSCFVLLPHIIKLLIPFIIGTIIYFLAKPLNKALKSRLPSGLSAFISLILTASLFVFIIWIALNTLIKELYDFAETISSYYNSPKTSFDTFFGGLTSISRRFSTNFNALPDISIFSESIGTALKDWISRTISSLSEFLLAFAKNIPSFIIIVFVSFFTAFFLLKDSEFLFNSFKKAAGEEKYHKFLEIKGVFIKVLGKYVKAQLIIELIMFCILFIGFSVLGVDYNLLFALISAVVDAVPILGTGTILIPWALFSLISGKTTLFWGLLSLYGICILTRQLCEPKIIGKNLGIHPLSSIVSIYIGLRAFGFFGILIGPVIALLIKSLFSCNFSKT